MAVQLQPTLRGPQSYELARQALQLLERMRIWPTPLNFELWIHYVGDPQGKLAQAIEQLVQSGEVITEAVSETLAAEHLPRLRLTEEIADAGDVLHQQLESVSLAIETAQRSNAAYGRTLDGASRELAGSAASAPVKKLVDSLAGATRRVQAENSALEQKLSESTHEVRRLQEHLEQVRRESLTDALTMLANRKAFDDALNKACSEASARGRPLSVAVIDIDHFKRFNDTWGHQTGDQVIRYVASVLSRHGEAPRTAARYGGEEFALVFPSEGAAVMARALESIRREIGSRQLKRRSTNEDLGTVSVSAGLAQLRPGESASMLLGRADEALYASKRGGRDRVTNGETLCPAVAAA